MKKLNDLKILLEDSFLTYYWIGFLLADGYFSKKYIKCTLSSKDKEHLIKLSNYININNIRGSDYIEIKAMDSVLVPLIKEKFDISERKTYNPPKNLEEIQNEDLLISLICGFIDGDGCISKKGNSFSLTVKCHSSWLNNLDFFGKTINGTTTAKINNAGYAYFTITNYKSLINLKNKANELNLPIMERKWDKINVNFIPHKEALDRNFDKLVKDYNKLMKYEYYREKLNKFIQ